MSDVKYIAIRRIRSLGLKLSGRNLNIRRNKFPPFSPTLTRNSFSNSSEFRFFCPTAIAGRERTALLRSQLRFITSIPSCPLWGGLGKPKLESARKIYLMFSFRIMLASSPQIKTKQAERCCDERRLAGIRAVLELMLKFYSEFISLRVFITEENI